ncbi:calcium-binding protein [Calothrix sp. CCY 0018]|uniref:calcium-binding protein n=1 Tax=Calothrix sp. CCY 0018 TaxID=3103864 RepID=UPI0039C7312D
MHPETLFLQPIVDPITNPNPNFATATGDTNVFNYSHSPSETLTDSQTETLIAGGVGFAIAEAQAIFLEDANFSFLFADSNVSGDGTFTGTSKSETKVVANFAIAANQTFSFDFSVNLALTAKEIENPNTEYNQANSKSTFLVLDTTNPDSPKVLDYFGTKGQLISSEQVANLKVGGSRNVAILSGEQISDIDGNNGSDEVYSNTIGSYQQTFSSNTNLTIVEINTSAVKVAGDSLIGNLGTDVIYGTIKKDKLIGTRSADKIYASLGNDKLYGLKGDDILEGGQGEDKLFGGKGEDKLNGGWGNDEITGGRGDDILVGGKGNDKFIFHRKDTFFGNDFDIIQDFEIGVDTIVFQRWGNIDTEQWLQQGNITDTDDGVLFKLDSLFNEQTLLISGVSSSQITSESIVFK